MNFKLRHICNLEFLIQTTNHTYGFLPLSNIKSTLTNCLDIKSNSMYYRHHGFTPYSIDLSNVHIVKYFGVIHISNENITTDAAPNPG